MSAPPFAVRVALSLQGALPYVAGAYLVGLAVIGIYVAIMRVRQRRTHRQLSELLAEARERAPADSAAAAQESQAESVAESERGHKP